MKRLVALAAFLLAASGLPAFAQSIAGQWQGTVEREPGTQVRFAVIIEEGASGALSGQIYNIDGSADASPIVLSRDGAGLTFVIAGGAARYEGVVSADGRTIKGSYTQTRTQPLTFEKATPQTAWVIDPTPHKVSFVTTSDGVKLEVIDWGGSGRPLVFLSGLGSTAHIFDKFVPQLTSKYRVYGVTRRGWGASDKPDPKIASYASARLGDDVREVIDTLKIEKPVLAGFSIGGAELSDMATRYPEKVSGLVYLDAAYAFAWYAPGSPMSLAVQANDLKAKLNLLDTTGIRPAEVLALIDEILKESLPHLQTELETTRKIYEGRTTLPQIEPPAETPLSWAIADATMAGTQRYSNLRGVPVLAIFASPQAAPPGASDEMLASLQEQTRLQVEQIRLFEAGNPAARVVRIANAQHAVFYSHPDDVKREMTAFIDGLE